MLYQLSYVPLMGDLHDIGGPAPNGSAFRAAGVTSPPWSHALPATLLFGCFLAPHHPVGEKPVPQFQSVLAAIRKLQEITGGFGVVMGFAHDWANRENTLRSRDLLASHVIPSHGAWPSGCVSHGSSRNSTRPS